jgi:predicted kinase
MPTAHLVCGATGSGKTIYAVALAARARAVRFSIDEWMATLFASDRPEPPSLEWTRERIQRCERQIWAVVEPTLAAGSNVVLDLRFFEAEHRDQWRARVAGTIAESKLHYLDVSRELRWARILERDRLRPPSATFEVTAATFDRMEVRFEPPTDDELYGAMILCEE